MIESRLGRAPSFHTREVKLARWRNTMAYSNAEAYERFMGRCPRQRRSSPPILWASPTDSTSSTSGY